MITIVGRHVVIEVRSTSPVKVSKKDFNESIDEVCIALKKNTDDIKHFVDNYPFAQGHQLRIYK
ncbi:hypothetical protein [Alkalihalophilus marmarensis]|uniref:hypothetical protein n=1 Tax=Alkalihalophilus marmarensis TaxID=521377 RepID=UPI002DB945F7|nr:hypothetical protein [Alkalihalophilus marmarensis]MEC2073991.1 hypothetical protein [Alkalihalophilus marmarensis]